MKSSFLKRLLSPKTIAVIGGRFAEAVIKQCDLIGFEGEIFPVNPKRNEMAGRSCFASVSDLPQPPDASFIAVDREGTVGAVAELAALGAGGAVCYASGFAEVGEAGQRWQERLLEAANGMPLVGPNCYGMLNYLDRVALWPDEHGGKAVNKGAAIVLQSGNIGLNLTMQGRGLPLAYLISVGNGADLQMHDYIEAFLEDERITCIGLHIEGLRDIPAFTSAALKALKQGVPIVALKTGTSDEGQKITFGHTSSLAGSDELYSAMFARYGVARVRTLTEFLETLKLLSTVGPLSNRKIASISCSGGEAAHVADLASELGLTFPPLNSAQEQALFKALGDKVALSNPLDYHTYIWNDEAAQERCFTAMLTGEQAVTLNILDYPRPELCDVSAWDKTTRAFINALKTAGSQGVIVSTLPENLPEQTRNWLISEGVAPMQGLEDCLLSICHAAQLFDRQQVAGKLEPLTTPPLSLGKDKMPNELESKKLLKEFGLNIPEARVISLADIDDARKACDALGYPLALKILSEDIVHKTDVGGVHLKLETFDAVAEAMQTMKNLGDTFLAERMLEKPITELLLGVTRDEQFGLSITLGAGGVLVELLKDSQTLLLPLTEPDVEKAIKALKIYPLLNGFRGGAKVRLEPITQAVMSLAKFADDYADTLLELDINPLFVFEDEVIVADAVIRTVVP